MKSIDYNYSLSFDDVLIEPTESNITSRLNVDTTVHIGHMCLENPLIASPMDTISEDEMVKAMSRFGGLAILHRFAKTNEEIISMIERIVEADSVALIIPSIGIGASGERLYEMIKDADSNPLIDGFCIDVANGHTREMSKMIAKVRYDYPDHVLIAGNVATREGFDFLASAGVDAVRVGIGGGAVCVTKIETGIGLPTFASILECAESTYTDKCAIIADGGIRYPSDLAKAIAAGARAVMCGSIFSGTNETPGNIRTDKNGVNWKVYRGMASREMQEEKRGGMKEGTSAEGISTYVKCKGPVKNVVNRFVGGLRSSMTYVNAKTIKEFQENAKFRRITQGGLVESHAHIENSGEKPVW